VGTRYITALPAEDMPNLPTPARAAIHSSISNFLTQDRGHVQQGNNGTSDSQFVFFARWLDKMQGKDNDMADVASRSFHIACDTSFLTFFTNRFPLPQYQSWQLVHLMPTHTLLVISTLDGKRFPLQQWMTASKRGTRMCGSNFAAMPTGPIPA
jgi:hypothetical protein